MIYQFSDKALKQVAKMQQQDKKKLAKALQNIESAKDLSEIKNIVKIKGSEHGYRIKITPYRILLIHINQNVEIKAVVRRSEGTYKNINL